MIQRGSVVKSMKGRDAGRFYVVVEVDNDRAAIADGKVRKLSNPKRKNIKHLSLTRKTLSLGNDLTDNRLKKALEILNNEID